MRHPAGGHPSYFQTLLPEQAGGRQTGRGAWPFSGQKDRGGAGWQSVGGEPAGRRQRVSDLFSTVRLSVWMEVNLQPAAYKFVRRDSSGGKVGMLCFFLYKMKCLRGSGESSVH